MVEEVLLVGIFFGIVIARAFNLVSFDEEEEEEEEEEYEWGDPEQVARQAA